MDFGVETKFVGDAYGGGFACGLSLSRSGTIEEFQQTEETPEASRYENGRCSRCRSEKTGKLFACGRK